MKKYLVAAIALMFLFAGRAGAGGEPKTAGTHSTHHHSSSHKKPMRKHRKRKVPKSPKTAGNRKSPEEKGPGEKAVTIDMTDK